MSSSTLDRSTPLGWIGLGVMGRSMAANLLRAGFPLLVHTRTKSKALDLLEEGATWADSPAEVAAQARVVFTIVGFPYEVRAVYFGKEGILSSARAGDLLIDMSTSSPSLAREISTAADTIHATALDAPVSGGDIGAREGKLSIMVGGERAAFEKLTPCWEVLGKSYLHQGGAGAGQHTKMANQILIANNMIGVCEALLYAYRTGLDLNQVLAAISGGAAGSWSLSNLAPRMIANQFDPGFFVEHFIKDMGIALEEASRMNLALPGLALARQMYVALAAQGEARSGTQALILALASLSGIDWKGRK